MQEQRCKRILCMKIHRDLGVFNFDSLVADSGSYGVLKLSVAFTSSSHCCQGVDRKIVRIFLSSHLQIQISASFNYIELSIR